MSEVGREPSDAGRAPVRDALAPDELTTLGPLLGLTPAVERLFEADTRDERLALVRVAIPFGLLFDNLHNLTTAVFMRDAVLIGLALRTGLLTSIGLLLWWKAPSLPGRWREFLFFGAMLGVVSMPNFLLWYSRDPNALFSISEYHLALVYGGLIVPIRFPFMMTVTVVGAVEACAVLLTKVGLPHGTLWGLILEVVTGSAFVLYGNYHIELRQRRSYLRTLREITRSEGLEIDKSVLANLSSSDPLTGLANRRALDAALDTALRDEAGHSVALLVVDIDHFKRFNDTYGHVAGDRCLRAVAEALTPPAWVGRNLVARYGGEEFAILLPGLDLRTAGRAAEAVRAAVEGLALRHAGRSDGTAIVTVSIGCAAITTGQGIGATAFLDEADAGLYLAKRLGRNRCASRSPFGDLPARGTSAAA